MGAALDSLDPETLHSSVLAFTPRLQDHGTNLTCQVKLPEVQATVERTTWLNVSCECLGGGEGRVPQGSGV